ncbi:MAG: P-loop NTPase [Bacillota bacterium]
MARDQASVLRRRAQAAGLFRPDPDGDPARTRTVAVSGGKGGVGKSNVSLNLACHLGETGREVILLDTDFGLPNLDVLTGCSPARSIGDVMRGRCRAGEALYSVMPGVRLLAGGQMWSDEYSHREQVRALLGALSAQMAGADYMIMDTQAGVAPAVMGLLLASETALMVTTPEPPALMDCYRTIKGLCRAGYEGEIAVVVNRARGGEAERAFAQLQHMVRSFLARRIRLLAWIPEDPSVGAAVQRQVPLLRGFPHSRASEGIRRLGAAISGEPSRDRHPARAFLRRLARYMSGGEGDADG